MNKLAVFALSPAIWGAAFVLFVSVTRDNLAKDVGMVGFVVGVELTLSLVGFVLALAQLPIMAFALFRGWLKVAGIAALGLAIWIAAWLVGMALAPSMLYVT